jgi:hypothetical protein
LVVSGLIIGLLTHKSRINFNGNENVELTLTDAPNASSEELLVDKVFTFLAPSDIQQFDDLYLYEELNYYILVEIVTPHNCEINITVIDPDSDIYQIFKTEVNISQGDQWFEIPFGTALSGNYTFIFSVITELNLNLYIKISFDREDKCLYDIMSPEFIANLELYQVNKFYDGTEVEHNVMLKTDVSYKFYLGRVSAIGGEPISQEVGAYYDLTDPEGIEFTIYANQTMKSVGEVLHFNFGTAVGGVYTVKIKIYCKVDVVNIAYAIAEDYSISTGINGTEPDPEPTNGTIQGYFYVPIEWTLGFVLSAGLVVGALIIIGSVRRKRNSVNLRTN